jgi:trk system potassium uptake protein TrkA
VRIVVVGAGAVGSYLAERLAAEGQDVVVVEDDPARAAQLQETLDCLVVRGNGASPRVLEMAGIGKADLLIAVSNSDEANVLACHAATQAGVPVTVARVEDSDLRMELQALGVDAVIDPGETTARELLNLIRRGGVSEIIDFAGGRLVLIGGHVTADAPAARHTLAELRAMVSEWNWLLVAVVHEGKTVVGRGDMTLSEGDHVLLMAKADQTEEPIRLMGFTSRPAKRVMIFGSTRLAGLATALFLDSGLAVTLIDSDPARCDMLADKYPKALVVCADPTDPKVLQDEGIERTDAVMALTGWDEVNILACLVSKALGVPTAVARFTRVQYVGLLEGVGIDAAVSSRLAAASAILRFVRRGRIHSVATFEDTDAEAIEIEVAPTSRAVGRTLQMVRLPRSSIVGGVLRDGRAFVPRGSTVIEPGDRLIVFTLPGSISDVEKLLAG